MEKLFQNLSIFIITNFYEGQSAKGLDGKNEIGSRDKATPLWERHRHAARIALWLTPPIPTHGRVLGASLRLGAPDVDGAL
jgi:hypothetical protein